MMTKEEADKAGAAGKAPANAKEDKPHAAEAKVAKAEGVESGAAAAEEKKPKKEEEDDEEDESEDEDDEDFNCDVGTDDDESEGYDAVEAMEVEDMKDGDEEVTWCMTWRGLASRSPDAHTDEPCGFRDVGLKVPCGVTDQSMLHNTGVR